jgi:hypothetical protein
VRFALVPALADAAAVVDVAVLALVLVVELLPQAAITRVVASVEMPSSSRRALRGVVLRTVMSGVLSRGI